MSSSYLFLGDFLLLARYRLVIFIVISFFFLFFCYFCSSLLSSFECFRCAIRFSVFRATTAMTTPIHFQQIRSTFNATTLPLTIFSNFIRFFLLFIFSFFCCGFSYKLKLSLNESPKFLIKIIANELLPSLYKYLVEPSNRCFAQKKKKIWKYLLWLV